MKLFTFHYRLSILNKFSTSNILIVTPSFSFQKEKTVSPS